MTTHSSGPGRFFDDVSKLMTNAMGVAQGAKDEAETAMKGWVDRWLADRNLVTREEFDVVREMAIKARAENAELRAMIAGMSGQAGGPDKDEAPHVSEADAPAGNMNPPDVGDVNTGDAPHVSEVEAPAADMNPPKTADSDKG
ncbi:accessory factor UbiK family protein [Paracoccus sp. MC1862]|nr:accessory factor UbiK family protein [Paracoccus sp. MC1854]MBB1498222.1 accessory factor UbiK family protein [Paracoccus sp. MC1862]QQO45713.1 accessory factor UbiK family protein [Paracoccus sp. MC1862]